jgi:hypothetical protein
MFEDFFTFYEQSEYKVLIPKTKFHRFSGRLYSGEKPIFEIRIIFAKGFLEV